MAKKYNNADTTLAGDMSASATSFVVKAGEGALFPPTAEAPYKITHEHYEGSVVTKKEVLTVSARSGDSFTISARATESCVQDESADPKVRSSNALSFSSGDRVYISITEEDWNELDDEIYVNIPQDIVDAKNDMKKEIQKGTVVYGSSSAGNDSYAITLDPVPGALSDLKGEIRFLADVANTGAATLNINSLGAKTIKKANDNDLETGDIEANQIVVVVYNATDDVFEMTSQISKLPTVDIDSLTEETSIESDDSLIFYDSSAGANKKIDFDKLGESIDLSVSSGSFQIAKSSVFSSVGFGLTSYTKRSEIEVSRKGTYTVSFSIQNNDMNPGRTIYGRIYVNGVATGTERSVAYNSGKQSFSENITINNSDKIQLYIRTSHHHLYNNSNAGELEIECTVPGTQTLGNVIT